MGTPPRMTAAPPLEVAPGLFVLEAWKRSGWGWSTVALRLPGGGTLLYSPSWLGERTRELVEQVGEPRVLLAPSHFHHLALARYRTWWPDALAVAPAAALPRLARKGHAALRPLDDALGLLPGGTRALGCEGVKSGEAWLSVPLERGRALLVCDAFMNVVRPLSGAEGFVVGRVLRIGPLCVSGTWGFMHQADGPRFRAWARETLRREQPTVLVPTHGAPVSGADLAERLIALLGA